MLYKEFMDDLIKQCQEMQKTLLMARNMAGTPEELKELDITLYRTGLVPTLNNITWLVNENKRKEAVKNATLVLDTLASSKIPLTAKMLSQITGVKKSVVVGILNVTGDELKYSKLYKNENLNARRKKVKKTPYNGKCKVLLCDDDGNILNDTPIEYKTSSYQIHQYELNE